MQLVVSMAEAAKAEAKAKLEEATAISDLSVPDASAVPVLVPTTGMEVEVAAPSVAAPSAEEIAKMHMPPPPGPPPAHILEAKKKELSEAERLAAISLLPIEVWLHIHVSQIKSLTDHLTDRLTRLEICLKLRSIC